MPDNVALYLLLLAALAIGFLLGRRDLLRRRERKAVPPGSYLTAYDHLAKEHQNLDLDEFVAAVVAHDDSIETRLALGSLVRRRGEVDKAIRVHQGLLARPVLTPAQRTRTELELARDYMAAGLLGRAENLLIDVARRDATERPTAQRALLEIYQREREWRQAVAVGREIARHDRSVRGQLAHLQCELAIAALQQGDLRAARQELGRASRFEPGCARIGLIGAEVELVGGQPRAARRHLERTVNLDPDLIPQTLEPYGRACREMSDDAGYVAFLERCVRIAPCPEAVVELAGHRERSEGAEAAAELVLEEMLRRPSLGGFVTLLEHLGRDGKPLGPEQLVQLHRYSRALLERQPAYRCRNCGFPSRSLMWQCPGCHEWGSCKPLVLPRPPA